MGTKAQPGKHDCYNKAHPDEPLFTLLARDPIAPVIVNLWADLAAMSAEVSLEKIAEARNCAAQMREWYIANN